MRTVLTDEEEALARYYSKIQCENKDKHRVGNDKQDPTRTAEEVAYDGIRCEMAVHKALGIPFKYELYIGGDKIDLVYQGKNISIKKVGLDGIMKVSKKQHENPKKQNYDYIFGLMPTFGNCYELIGYISKEDFMEHCYEHTYHTPTICLSSVHFKRFKQDRNKNGN